MKRYAILLIGGLAAVVCVRLGFWQLDRLEQRRERNAEIEARLALPPLSVAGRETARADLVVYRRVTARGRYDFAREVVLLARARRGVPGVHIVTPLLLNDSTAILVERGWAPSPNGRDIELRSYRESADAAVEGVLLQPSANRRQQTIEERWPLYVLTADPEPFAARFPYALYPLLLRRTTAREPIPTAMRAVELPDRSDGSHLSYAIQWFTFATIAMVGSVLLFRRSSTRDDTALSDVHIPDPPS